MKLPPAYRSLPDTASAYTSLFIPEPSALQLLPFHLAMPLAIDVAHHGEVAADVEIARTIHHRRVNSAVRAGDARHADPVGVAEGRVNAHGIDRLRIVHQHGQMREFGV